MTDAPPDMRRAVTAVYLSVSIRQNIAAYDINETGHICGYPRKRPVNVISLVIQAKTVYPASTLIVYPGEARKWPTCAT